MSETATTLPPLWPPVKRIVDLEASGTENCHILSIYSMYESRSVEMK